MQIKNALVKDGAWVAATQILAALGTLAGVRLLTEFLSPAQFGAMSLWLGVVTFVTASLANPTMQALLRYYPEYAEKGQGGDVRLAARLQVEKMLMWSFPLLAILAGLSFWQGWASPLTLFLFVLVLGIDIIRIQHIAVLSAARLQKTYGIWLAAEAWLRPASAVLLMKFFGVSLDSVLAGYFMASLLLFLVLRSSVPSSKTSQPDAADLQVLKSQFWQYTWPLLPLGLVGWLSGVGDRYIIGGVLGIADVGIYAAIYGLASRPVLMLGAIIETTLRPIYQQAAVSEDRELQRSCLKKWLAMLLVCSAFGLALAFTLHDWLAKIFLGPAFRDSSYLIPWLVLAHILLILAQRNGRILYAFSRTADLAKVETIPVMFALLFSWVLASRFGLQGAVMAVIIGFGMQWLMACFFTHSILKYSAAGASSP